MITIRKAKLLRRVIEHMATELSDTEALEAQEFFPK